VVQMPLMSSDVPAPEYVFEEILENANENLEILKKKLSQRTNELVPITTEMVIGTVEHQIEQVAADKSATVVVMGLNDSSGAERFLLGSHALFAAKHLHYPLLLVPGNAKFKAIKKIGMACDLVDVHALPFATIKEWMSPFEAELNIIHVGKNQADINSKAVSETVSLHNRLNRFHPKFHFLASEKLEEGLRKAVKDFGLDMLIVFPKKHGLLDMFSEKHVRKIVLGQNIPVLLMHNELQQA